jgi:hypothetical protein
LADQTGESRRRQASSTTREGRFIATLRLWLFSAEFPELDANDIRGEANLATHRLKCRGVHAYRRREAQIGRRLDDREIRIA